MVEELKNFLPLNFPLLINPVNWIIVFLMLAMAGLILAILADANNTQNIVE